VEEVYLPPRRRPRTGAFREPDEPPDASSSAAPKAEPSSTLVLEAAGAALPPKLPLGAGAENELEAPPPNELVPKAPLAGCGAPNAEEVLVAPKGEGADEVAAPKAVVGAEKEVAVEEPKAVDDGAGAPKAGVEAPNGVLEELLDPPKAGVVVAPKAEGAAADEEAPNAADGVVKLDAVGAAPNAGPLEAAPKGPPAEVEDAEPKAGAEDAGAPNGVVLDGVGAEPNAVLDGVEVPNVLVPVEAPNPPDVDAPKAAGAEAPNELLAGADEPKLVLEDVAAEPKGAGVAKGVVAALPVGAAGPPKVTVEAGALPLAKEAVVAPKEGVAAEPKAVAAGVAAAAPNACVGVAEEAAPKVGMEVAPADALGCAAAVGAKLVKLVGCVASGCAAGVGAAKKAVDGAGVAEEVGIVKAAVGGG
jgi:hypothetical protein